jgi:hypothetical protein
MEERFAHPARNEVLVQESTNGSRSLSSLATMMVLAALTHVRRNQPHVRQSGQS